MPVTVRCPECDFKVRVRPGQRRVTCPECDHAFRPDADERKSGAQVAIAAVVLMAFAALSVGAFFLTWHLAKPAPRVQPEVAAAPPKADPQPEPKPLAKAASAVVAPNRAEKPARPPLPQPRTVTLDGPVTALYVGGSGKYLVFHLGTARQLVVYDVAASKVISTVNNIDPNNSRVAVSRDKLFVGRRSDVRLTRYDPRTGAQEATAVGVPGERLEHMAVGSNSDGPLVLGVTTNERRYQARLYDADTLATVEADIDDPLRADARRFPFNTGLGAAHVAVSADGRAISLGDRLFTRTGAGYAAVSVNPSSGLRPSPDGSVLTGNSLVESNGRVVRFEDRAVRWMIPAADGPFFLGIEYGRADGARLMLHADRDPKPLGELPGTEHVTELLARAGGGVVSAYQHVTFLPEPGYVVYALPNSRQVQMLPVDRPALLEKYERDMLFTSAPPAFASKGRAYEYTATALGRNGLRPVAVALEAGPLGMTAAPDGRVTWTPPPGFDRPAVDVRLVATSVDGKQTLQAFTLFVK